MGHWRELWVESVVPLKPYPLKYLNPFTLLPCVETSVSENISSVSLWFLVSIKFFPVNGVTPPMWTARHQAMTAHTCLSGFKVHLPVCLPIEKVTTGVRHCSYLLQTIISVLLIQRSHWPRPTVNFSFTKLRWMKFPPKYPDFRGSYSVPSFLRKLNFTVIIILSSFKDTISVA